MTLRVWALSDLHLDATRGWDLPPPGARPDSDVLVVAGDTMPGFARGVRWIAERVTDRPVIMVAGNHESFGRDIDREIEKGREAARGTNVTVLHDDGCIVGDVAFVGATFWADFELYGTREASMAAAADQLNDFRRIRVHGYSQRLRPHHTLARHRSSRTAIELGLLLNADCRRRVVVTHHPIHAYGSRSRPALSGDAKDLLAPAYMSDCSAMFALGVDAAIAGHTHVSLDLTVGTTRLIQNPKGYGPWSPGERWENPDFDVNFTFDI